MIRLTKISCSLVLQLDKFKATFFSHRIKLPYYVDSRDNKGDERVYDVKNTISIEFKHSNTECFREFLKIICDFLLLFHPSSGKAHALYPSRFWFPCLGPK